MRAMIKEISDTTNTAKEIINERASYVVIAPPPLLFRVRSVVTPCQPASLLRKEYHIVCTFSIISCAMVPICVLTHTHRHVKKY